MLVASRFMDYANKAEKAEINKPEEAVTVATSTTTIDNMHSDADSSSESEDPESSESSTESSESGKTVRSVVVKTRSATTKGPVRKPCKRSTSVPVDRKENFYETLFPEPGAASVITVPRSRSKICKKKNEVARKKPGGLRPSSSKAKLQAIKETQDTPDETPCRPKLHEICFIKSSEGKRMVAKYKAKSDQEEDNLIVEWDSQTNKAQVFAHKLKPNAPPPKPLFPDAGPSREGVFRVHNFAKTSSLKIKQRNKRPLRRLANTVEASKLDKMKKRKIIKSQV